MMSSGGESSVSSYPRKRVAIACDICRLRKTRCDAAKPVCSFCTENGIECRYTGPSQDDRRLSTNSEYTRTLRRLEDIQSTLDAVAAAVGAGHSELGPTATTSSYDGSHSTASPVSQSTASRTTPVPRMPNLLFFKALAGSPLAISWSYDYIKDFFRHQMKVEDDICEASRILDCDLDLSKPHLWRLQHAFVENVLKWLPLFDHATATIYLQSAKLEKTEDDSVVTCLVLLMYATGALSADSSLYQASPLDLPGFPYYVRAVSSLRRLPRSSESMCILQCHVLLCIYHLLAMRPLEAWKVIRQASQTCIFLLKAQVVDQSADYQQSFKRIYWICYVLESELEISLELPTSGLRDYEEIVELPTSQYDEEGMYNLLALSSLRRLMVEVVDTVGLRSSAVKYAPVVTLELRNQIDHWYRHLPSSLHFPADQSLLFDVRKAYLRCMYNALIVVAFWPFVPRCRDIIHDNTSRINENTFHAEEGTQALQGAEQCLEASRNYLKVAEQILTQKTLVSHMILRSYFTTTMILLLVHPIISTPSPAAYEDTSLILHAMRNLVHWSVVPFMKRPLEEMTSIAQLKGVLNSDSPLQWHPPDSHRS